MRVLVAHPTRQHSHRLAEALQGAGLLHSYWTLLPDSRALSWLPGSLAGLLPSAVFRHSLQFLPKEKVHILIGPLLFQGLATRFNSVALRQLGEWMAWAVFDRWVAAQLPRLRPRVVVGYEMGCAETFRVARELGINCVLDAAAFHHAMQDKILDEDKYAAKTWAGKRLRLRKQKEIELSGRIICVSELARRSYIDAGVDKNLIVVNPVGCDVTKFACPAGLVRSGAPKFVFVGMPGYRKGFDLLTESFNRLLPHCSNAELHVVGDPAMAARMMGGSRARIHGKFSHDQLSKLLTQVDCLVLPARLESFGMVVVEALAAGVPVIVSDHAGTSEAVKEGENGWVVPAGDGAALFERMLSCCRDIEGTRSMSVACTRSAAEHDWSHYSKRAVAMFAALSAGVA